jgi:hypothetical protein
MKDTTAPASLVPPGTELAEKLVLVGDHEVPDLIRDQFGEQDVGVPDDSQVAALSSVVAGYLRTSPLRFDTLPVAASFVTACVGWWTRDLGDAGGLTRALADAFQGRPLPEQNGMHMLVALGAATLHAAGLQTAGPAATRAVADWIAALYLGGAEDWQ